MSLLKIALGLAMLLLARGPRCVSADEKKRPGQELAVDAGWISGRVHPGNRKKILCDI
jgi:hypothetical protein